MLLALRDKEAVMDSLALQVTRDNQAQRELWEASDLLDSQVTLA